MLTKQQLNQIAQDFRIDTFTVFREYFQLVFLNYLYQEKQAENIFFKGGTCLRLLHNSPRFSEDLDFSTSNSRKDIEILLKNMISKLQKEIPQTQLSFIWKGKNSLRYKIKYQAEEFKYPLSIRLDFFLEKPVLPADTSTIKSKIPLTLFPFIVYLKKEEVLAEKIRAFLIRAKGRDIFDIWYLLERDVKIDKKLLEKKLKKLNRVFDEKKFSEKIKKYPTKKLEMDLSKFLPKNYRKVIPVLQDKLLEKFI